MKGMPFSFAGKGIPVPPLEIKEARWKKPSSEPTSVLDTHRSPSSTSTSSLSSSLGGGSDTEGAGGIAAVSDDKLQKWTAAGEPLKEEWPMELVGKCGIVVDEWENMMVPSGAIPETHENSLLRWMMGEVDDALKPNHVGSDGYILNNFNGTIPFDGPADCDFDGDPATWGFGSGFMDVPLNGVGASSTMAGFAGVPSASKCNPCSIGVPGNGIEGNGSINSSVFVPSNNSFLPATFSPGNFNLQLQPAPMLTVDKPQMNLFSTPQGTNLGFLMPEMPPAKRHQPLPLVKPELQRTPHSKKVEFSDSGQDVLQQMPRSRLAGSVPDEAAQLTVVDHLHRAAELMGSGNSAQAMAILARLNHHLSSPIGKPLYRAAFYFKEALLRLSSNAHPVPELAVPVTLRLGAYKAFCEISPLVQFASFTCNQAILDALSSSLPAAIHILDFDIGIGVHWASFMQEISLNVARSGHCSLKITAFTSPSSNDQLELALTRENLSSFAFSVGISFQFNAVNLECFDQSVLNLGNSGEVLCANLPVSVQGRIPSQVLPSLLQFVKELSPKIVVSADYACDRTDLPFARHFLHSLEFFSLLFDSLGAMNVNSNTLGKIESLLMKPKIEKMVSSRYHASGKLPPWRNLLVSSGFKPYPFSKHSETQAECIVKRFNLRGFHVEKHRTSLLLLWQRRELMSASAWTC